jgi:hypothetical protein
MVFCCRRDTEDRCQYCTVHGLVLFGLAGADRQGACFSVVVWKVSLVPFVCVCFGDMTIIYSRFYVWRSLGLSRGAG